jgi:hypothetical protein
MEIVARKLAGLKRFQRETSKHIMREVKEQEKEILFMITEYQQIPGRRRLHRQTDRTLHPLHNEDQAGEGSKV